LKINKMITITEEEFDLLRNDGRVPYLCDSCGDNGGRRKRDFEKMPKKVYCSVKCRVISERNNDANIKKLMDSRNMVFIESYHNPFHRVKYKCICGECQDSTWDKYKNSGGRCRKCSLMSTHRNKRIKFEILEKRVIDAGYELITRKEEWEGLDQIEGFRYKLKCKRGHEFTTARLITHEIGCRACSYIDMTGEKSPNYKHGKSRDNIKERRNNSVPLKRWRRHIVKLFKNTCDICSINESGMNAHHLNGYLWDIDNRFNLANGVLLCKNCHKKFHKKYGIYDNTREQYQEFKKEETEPKFYDWSDWFPDNQTGLNL